MGQEEVFQVPPGSLRKTPRILAIKEKPSRVAIVRTSTRSLISTANSIKDSQVWLDSDTSEETL